MINGIIVIGVIVILAILLVLFRVNTLLNVAKDNANKRVTGSNKVNSMLFILFLLFGFGLFFWYSSTYWDDYTLPIASEHGKDTDNLFWVTTAITGVVFVITHILLFVFPARYMYNENRRAKFYPDNNKLELAWTVLPAIVLAVLIYNGWRTWSYIMDKSPENTEIVEIYAYQFGWSARYPGADGQLGATDFRKIDAVNASGVDFNDANSFDDIIPGEIHIPKGVPVEFKIRAKDVIHSLFIPEFRLQMNAVPGMRTRFWFTPTHSTQEMRDLKNDQEWDYRIVCNKICGRAHYSMIQRIYVDEPEDYKKWLESQDTFLKQNPELAEDIPVKLKELAYSKSGLDKAESNQ